MLGLARGITSLGVVLAIASSTTSGRAAPTKVRVDWPTVPGCPDAKSVTLGVQRELARATAADTVLARAEIQPPATPGEPWRVWIRTRTIHGAGERTLDADTCAELGRAASLLVALAATRPTTPPRKDEIAELVPSADWLPEPEPLALARPLDLPRPQPPAGRAESSSRFVMSAGVWSGAGLLPSLAWGPTVTGSYEIGPWALRLAARAALPQDRLRGALGATFDALGVGADLCRTKALVRDTAFNARACGGFELDAIRARGIGGMTEEHVRAEALPFVGLGASWSPTQAVRIGLDVRGGPTLLQSSFAVATVAEGVQRLHQPHAVRVEGALTCGFVF